MPVIGSPIEQRSPKLHGTVERANRTHTEEFYEVTLGEPELAAFQIELRAWETVYDTIRPHQALGYLTQPNISPRLASMCNGGTGRVGGASVWTTTDA